LKIFFGIILIICLFLSFSCEEAPSNLPPPTGTMQNTPTTPTLLSTPEELETIITDGMTLLKVYASMTVELKNSSIIYPAQDIHRQSDGKWSFTAKDGGSPGDTDSPFQVLIFIPKSLVAPHYIILFENKRVFHDAWFEYDAATGIQKLLWTTETTD